MDDIDGAGCRSQQEAEGTMTDKSNETANQLPWDERVTMLSINPDAATREDVADMAAELMEKWADFFSERQRAEAAESSLLEERDKVIEECAKVCEQVYGGKGHTYASENAHTYRTQDGTIASCAKAIRALKDKP